MHEPEAAKLAAALVAELARQGIPSGYWLMRLGELRDALRTMDRFVADFEEALNAASGSEPEPPPELRPP